MPDLFVGTWDLVPELSMYAVGDPPASGRYELRRDGTWIHVMVKWTAEAAGPEHTVAYGGPLDGTPQPLPARAGGPVASGPDAMTLTRIDSKTLDSAALRGKDVVAYARRQVSNDGSLLAVVQEARQPDGTVARNFQVYRRATVRS